MPQDKKLSNKDYIAGKGDYLDKYAGTIGEMDETGFLSGGKRNARVDAAGRNAQYEMGEQFKKYNNRKSPLGLIKTLGHMVKTERTGTAAGRRMGMKEDAAEEYGRQTARNSRPSYGAGNPVAKPVSAAAGAKMISALNPKSNGTFKGGSPRSSMSKNLKIK